MFRSYVSVHPRNNVGIIYVLVHTEIGHYFTAKWKIKPILYNIVLVSLKAAVNHCYRLLLTPYSEEYSKWWNLHLGLFISVCFAKFRTASDQNIASIVRYLLPCKSLYKGWYWYRQKHDHMKCHCLRNRKLKTPGRSHMQIRANHIAKIWSPDALKSWRLIKQPKTIDAFRSQEIKREWSLSIYVTHKNEQKRKNTEIQWDNAMDI